MWEGFGGVTSSGGKRVGRHPKEKVKETPEVVVFIPHTPGGELKKRLQEVDDKLVQTKKLKRVKFVKRGATMFRGFCVGQTHGRRSNVVMESVWCVELR